VNARIACGATALQLFRSHAEVALMAAFAVFAYGILAGNPASAPVRTLSLIFTSIVLEALPFMLLGAFVGGMIEVFVSRERMTLLLPKRGWMTIAMAAGMGIIFPICECAVVPVVRRLVRKGLPASGAIAYLLGGPIVNPIVAASTSLAYNFDWRMVGLRMIFGYGIAVTVAMVMDRVFGNELILRKDLHDDPHEHYPTSCAHGREKDAEHESALPEGYAHNMDAPTCGCEHGLNHEQTARPLHEKFIATFRHAADDFLAVGHLLVVGAYIAALAQTFIDRKIFFGLAQQPVLPSLMMISLAIFLNLCSEADAFIAASFRGLISMPAQMAFLLTGPMFDLKLLLMYQHVFRRRAIANLAGLIIASVVVVAICLEIFYGKDVSR